jgi:hypothetical protein
LSASETELGPYCDLCATRPTCDRAGKTLLNYPACQTFLRNTPPQRVSALFAYLAGGRGERDPRLAQMLARLLRQFERDGGRFSEILEPSVSWREGHWQLLRFSYAYPAFREDPIGTIERLLAICAPFGDETCGWVRALLGPAKDPCVTKPLIGLAYDDQEHWRIKLYVEFEADAGARPLRLAGRLLGRNDLAVGFEGQELHLLGIDLGPRGIIGAKLYFRRRIASITSLRDTRGTIELVEHLASVGVEQLRNLLVIHRIAAPGDPDAFTPVEIDFALAENGLRWRDLQAAPTLVRARGQGDDLAALEQAFRLGFRRVSVPIGRTDKLNAYYVLAE